MRSCVVTGAAGFVGSHLTLALLNKEWEVFGIDDFSSGEPKNLFAFADDPRFRFLKTSIMDPGLLQIPRFYYPGADVIFHLAAIVGTNDSTYRPVETMTINFHGTKNLLEDAEARNFKSFVFAGSAAEYEPKTPYGCSKKMASDLVSNSNIGTSLRFFNIYGPRQRDDSEGGVVAIFIRNILEGDPITIYGDGNQTRDFLYVSDAVDAYLASVDMAAPTPFDVGTGVSVSINELVATIEEVSGEKAEIEYEEARPGDILHSKADPENFTKVTGWKPKVSLKEGIQKCLDWVS